jgi:hypothetical protein
MWAAEIAGVRGLPAWYQALAAFLPTTAIALLWLTHFTDPGIIPPTAVKGAPLTLLWPV